MADTELQAANDYFAFLGKKISEKEIQSMLPFFDCDEPGHVGNALDQVCLESDCKHKGLCCVRCSYQKHRLHPNSVYPLHTFVSQLINQMSNRKLILEEQKKKCIQYRDVVVSLLRDYLNNLIEHLSLIVSQIHKYYTLFENSYENVLIKSHIIVHSLIYKKHIPRDKFQRYVRDGVKSVSFNKEFTKPSSDYYSLSETKPTRLEEKFKNEHGVIIINEQEKAFEMSNEFVEEMHKVAQRLQQILKASQENLFLQVDLNKLSPKIPKFEKAELIDMKQFKKQFNLDSVFKLNDQQQQQQQQQQQSLISTIPTLNDYLHKETLNSQIDSSRQKCVLGMLFDTLSNCSILKLGSLKSQQNEISCFAALNSDLIVIAARFSPYIEIYRLQDKRMIQRIDTKSQQGVKCMLIMNRATLNITSSAESEATLIVGLYYDQSSLQSYQLQIFRQDNKYSVNQQSSGLYHSTENNSAATCLTEIYQDYFVAGYSTGTISIFYRENPEPLHSLSYLYDKAVQGISIIEVGKQFISFSQDKSRLHNISNLNVDKIVHNISQVKLLANPTYQIIVTDALNDDKSNLKLYHFVCGEHKEQYEPREQGLRFFRLMKDDPKMSLIDEGSISNFRDLGNQNSVKDLVILEPRKKISKIWCIAVGENNKLQLWEIRRAMSQNIKLWEKDLEDFLKPVNHSIIKGKLLAESQEYTILKYFDVGPKVNILKVTENPANGRFNVMLGVINHESKTDIDIFDIELMSY